MGNKEKLEKALKEIGYYLRHCGLNHYEIMNHKKKSTDWILFGNELKRDGENQTTIFSLKYAKIEILPDGNCLSISEDTENPKHFLNLYNFIKDKS